MNLLKQTAVILGLVSLVIGCWAIYRHWRSRITILVSLFCFTISVWAFSFVSYETLLGRFPYDVHLFCNILLAPISIALLNKILFKRADRFSVALQGVSIVGAVVVASMVVFVHDRASWMTDTALFYPSLILVEYLYGMGQDVIFRVPTNTDFISPAKKILFYAGLAFSLAFCTFDHIPATGYTIPALGNLLLTVYLVFASQAITPQKLLRMESLISRFLAIVILALIITGFFALLYPYISETFGLFLLNSFLISFAVLSLWSPLVTFFRFLGASVFRSQNDKWVDQVANFKLELSTLTDPAEIRGLTITAVQRWTRGGKVSFVEDVHGIVIPERVKTYFESSHSKKGAIVLHREILMMEHEQTMLEAERQNLTWLLQYLDTQDADIILPTFYQASLVLLTRIRMETAFEELNINLSLFGRLYDVLQDVGVALVRLTRVAEEREKARLVLMGEMAAGLAHEVRNPLGAIRGAAELLTDHSSPWVKVIQEEVLRLNRLVSQFLDFAQDPKEQKEEINLAEVATASLQAVKAGLPANVNVSLSGSKTATVFAVPDHLRQVLINLIQNSVKATENIEAAEIEIKVAERMIVVKDNGFGMTDEVKQKVFQPFFTSFKNGTGLGLSICQRLMSFNDANIKIASEAGKGTEVSVLFPARLVVK